MVVLPEGGFDIGSPADEPGRWEAEGPQSRIHIRQFAVGKFHVRRGEWAAFVAATHRETKGGCSWSGLPSRWKIGRRSARTLLARIRKILLKLRAC